MLKSRYQCLLNLPPNLPLEASLADEYYPGQMWSLDDQCKMRLGQSASFCRVFLHDFCYNSYFFYETVSVKIRSFRLLICLEFKSLHLHTFVLSTIAGQPILLCFIFRSRGQCLRNRPSMTQPKLNSNIHSDLNMNKFSIYYFC